MQAADFLLSVAEISVAFAGFSGIVAVIGRRATGEWSTGDVLRFWQMIEVSLLALIFSLVPFGFHYLGLSESDVWAASSGLLALASGLQTLRSLVRNLRAAGSDASLSLLFSATFFLIAAVVIVVLVLNALGIIFQRAVGPYLIGIFWQLLLACVLFWRLLKYSGVPYKAK
jgi:hypothetical protein